MWRVALPPVLSCKTINLLRMKINFILPFIGGCVASLMVGCTSVDRKAARAVDELRRGEYAFAVEWSGEMATNSVYSSALGRVESGRVHMLAGDAHTSANCYRAAIDTAIDRQEAQPKIKFGDVGNTVLASTVTDDRTRNYELSPYELNLALEHGIIAEDMAGLREDALVDCRLAVYVQDQLAEKYGADVAAASSSTDATAQRIYEEKSAALNEMIAATRNSWENPVLWWLTGVHFEADGDFDMAAQSYRKAAAVNPNCSVFVADATRAEQLKPLASDRAKLVVVVGEGFISRRVALKVPIPIYTMMSFDMPMYNDLVYQPQLIGVALNEAAPTAAAPALNIQSLAARDLKEHMPGIIARNLSRAAVQAAAQAAVNNSGNAYAQLGVLAANAVVSAIRSADLRSWVTLPMGEQVWVNSDLTPGTYRVRAANSLSFDEETVALQPGETKVIYLNLVN